MRIVKWNNCQSMFALKLYYFLLVLHARAQPSTGETQESMNNVSCRRDMTEILLKAA